MANIFLPVGRLSSFSSPCIWLRTVALKKIILCDIQLASSVRKLMSSINFGKFDHSTPLITFFLLFVISNSWTLEIEPLEFLFFIVFLFSFISHFFLHCGRFPYLYLPIHCGRQNSKMAPKIPAYWCTHPV